MPPANTNHVHTAKRPDHRGDLLAYGIAEHADGEPRIGLFHRRLVQVAHVVADARDASQAGSVIDQISILAASNFFSRIR